MARSLTPEEMAPVLERLRSALPEHASMSAEMVRAAAYGTAFALAFDAA